MKHMLFLKWLTLLLSGLLSAWLIFAQPTLPTLPKTKEKVLLSLSFQYNSRTPPTAIDAIISRPLFTPTRRTVISSPDLTIPAIHSPEIATSSLTGFVLLGIITSSDDRTGLLKTPGNIKPRTVHEGDVLDGWQIENIQNSFIALKNGNVTHELFLRKKPDTQPSTP